MVQLYLHDVVAQVARPVKQLIGYARVSLDAGASRSVRFRVHADRFAYTGRDYQRIVEPGDVELLLGNSAVHLPWCETLRVTGPTRVVGHDRRLVTPVEVTQRTRVALSVNGKDVVSTRTERATLAKIASATGVSVSTVSKVVNGRPDVAPITRSMVQQVLQRALL